MQAQKTNTNIPIIGIFFFKVFQDNFPKILWQKKKCVTTFRYENNNSDTARQTNRWTDKNSHRNIFVVTRTWKYPDCINTVAYYRAIKINEVDALCQLNIIPKTYKVKRGC